MVEHSTADREVPGSNPGVPSMFLTRTTLKTMHRLHEADIQCISSWEGGYNSCISACRLNIYVSRALPRHFTFTQGPPEASFWNNFHFPLISIRWSSGRILACHAGDPGSIPGRCRGFLFFRVSGFKLFQLLLYTKHHRLKIQLVSRFLLCSLLISMLPK